MSSLTYVELWCSGYYRGCMGDLVAWAVRLASEKLAEVLPRRWAHVQGVGRGAGVAAPLFLVDDGELLVGAALLHDIGYAPDLASSGFHALDGARYLRGIDGPDRLVNLVAHHSCATVEAEVRGLSGELAEFEDEGTRGVPRSYEIEDLEGPFHDPGCPSGGLGDVSSSDQVDRAHSEVA